MKNIIENIIKYILQVLALSAGIVLFTSSLSVLVGSLVEGYFYTGHVFRASLAMGMLILAVGILILIKPEGLKREKLLDHSNYAQVVHERREIKRKRAMETLIVGIVVTLIAGFLEIFLG